MVLWHIKLVIRQPVEYLKDAIILIDNNKCAFLHFNSYITLRYACKYYLRNCIRLLYKISIPFEPITLISPLKNSAQIIFPEIHPDVSLADDADQWYLKQQNKQLTTLILKFQKTVFAKWLLYFFYLRLFVLSTYAYIERLNLHVCVFIK